jgi:TRAP-type C4-dicarboxylate transport system substrate-binding protein
VAALSTWVQDARADVAADWLAGKLAGSSPVSYAGPAKELKFAHPAPPASLIPPVWQASIARLAAASGQKLLFKEYGAGTLIGPRDGFKAVRSGVAEWATCYVQFEGRGFPLSKVFELPFVAPANPMVSVRIAQELAPKYFAPEFAKQGVVWAAAGHFNATDIMSKRPVRRVEDLRGMKILAQGFAPEAAKALGATLVNIPYPEIYTAFQQGLVDAVFWIDAGFIPYKIFEVAKHHTTLGLTGSAINHCYNKPWFDALPQDLQRVFYELQEPMAMAMSKITQIDFGKTAAQVYAEKGVEMIKLPPAEIQRFRDRLEPVVNSWAEDLEKSGVPARQLLQDIRRASAKYESMSADDLMMLSIKSPVAGIR